MTGPDRARGGGRWAVAAAGGPAVSVRPYAPLVRRPCYPYAVIVIDGSAGEGGGQILRTSLALSVVTGRPFRIERIRAHRAPPGLRRQHLAAVRAAAAVGRARVAGAEPGSQGLTFEPAGVAPGEHRFAVGTAGSAILVAQTVLPALLCAAHPSTLVVEGGTHNPFAPPFEHLSRAFLPLLARMGARVHARLDRAGFHPAGGGRLTLHVEPAPRLARLDLVERGAETARRALAIVSRLPRSIAERELRVAGERLAIPAPHLRIEEAAADGPGNVVLVEIACERVTAVFSAFGRKGLPAETVAAAAADDARRWLDSGAAADDHLADQLLLPLSLASGGTFTSPSFTSHASTNADVIRRFLPVAITHAPTPDGRAVLVRVDPTAR